VNGDSFVGMRSLRCHASDSNDAGHQVQCAELAWADCPARDAQGRLTFRLPLCFRHAMALLRVQAEERAR